MSNHMSHDGFFRYSLSDQKIAHDFFEAHLPEAMKKKVDLSTLKQQPDTFVDKELSTKITDMLYSVNIEGKPGYLYMLCEMQTRPEKHMALRMLSYVVRILEKHVQQHPNEPLPAVYRIVYYQGRRSPYPYSQNIADLFGDLTLAEQTLIEPFQLIDLTCIEDEVLRSHKSAALMELVQKHIFSRDILPHLHEFIQLLDTVIKEGSGDYLTAVLNYIISKAEISDKQKALEMLQSALPEAQESIMNLAQHWKQEGIQQSKAEIVQNMLRKGLDHETITEVTGFSESELAKLVEKTKN